MKVGGGGDGGNGHRVCARRCVLGVFEGGGAEEDAAGEGAVVCVWCNVWCNVRLRAMHVIVAPNCGDDGLREGAV